MKKKDQGRIDIYFLGDSITRRWGAGEEKYKELLANWNQNLFGWNAANFGLGGDKTQNVLWRLEQGELDGVHPKIIVLLVGTNNVGRITPIGTDQARVDDITRGVKRWSPGRRRRKMKLTEALQLRLKAVRPGAERAPSRPRSGANPMLRGPW